MSDKQEATPDWMNDAINIGPGELGGAEFAPEHPQGPRIILTTVQGVKVCNQGDWIIRGPSGVLEVADDMVFNAKYEPIDSGPESGAVQGEGQS